MSENLRWVRLLTKTPINMSNDARELLKYYCEHKGLKEFPKQHECYCCCKEKSNMAAAFVVDAYGENRNLYLTFICLSCLEERIKEPENPIAFQALYEDLLLISKYDPSSNFTNLSINEP